MEAYVARPKAKAGPAVLVLMEIFGVNPHIQSICDRLASAGYVAMAYNYYHRTTPNLTLDYTDESVQLGRQHKEQTTRAGLIADAEAAMAWLRAQAYVQPDDRFGCMGFCFGGHVAYLLATLPDIVATASFYGAGIARTTPGGGAEPTLAVTPDIHGDILCFFGGKDPLIPAEDVKEIEGALLYAGVDHQLVRYPDAGHGFVCDARKDYHAQSAKDAWKRTLNLFESRLMPHKAGKK
jgi:carboxymethylenebutenolidase